MQLKRITIIGGGIGGLAAALALQRRGFRVSVYERAQAFREIGAGLIITANARGALRDLGVDDALAMRSSCVPVIHACDYATGAVQGSTRNRDIEARWGAATLQVHRGDLHDVLKEAVVANDPDALHAGCEFAELEQDESGVTAIFTDGRTAPGDALIGADGNTSAVRSFVFPGEAAGFNGQVAYRALIPQSLIPERVRELQMGMYAGPGRYMLFYALRGGSIMNLIGCGRATTWEAEGWSIPASNEEFEAAYADFAPHLVELIRAIPSGELFKWGLRDREPLARWVDGRVAMLGDAAHPMTPFLGQGACLALEDGLVLGRAFAASNSVEEALQRYEVARRIRGTNVQLWSREEGLALQDPSIPQRPAAARGLLEYDPATVTV